MKYAVEIISNHSIAYVRTDDHEEAQAAAKAWNADGYEVRLIADKTNVLADMPAPADTNSARFERDIELIQTVDEAIERLVSIRVNLDTTD